MERLFESLRPLIRAVVRHPFVVLGIALILSVAGVSSAIRLTVNPDLSQLLPSDYESVRALERLRNNIGGSAEAAVAIVSPSREANRAYAEALIPMAGSLTLTDSDEPLFTRIEYRKDVDFVKDNALYFASRVELSNVEDYLQEQKEEAVLEENPFFFDIEDDDFDSDEEDEDAEALRDFYNQIVQDEYPESEDGTTLVLRFYPAGSQSDIGFIEDLYARLDSVTSVVNPQSFHSEMEVVLAGRLQRSLVEIRAITDDLFSSFGAGIMTVLFVVVGYFFYKSMQAQGKWSAGGLLINILRLPALAFIIAIPLLMSLSWTFGLAYLVYAELNLMTTTLGLVLFGLGIDFGIHFYARYAEERGAGHEIAEAAEKTFLSTGQAVTVGALTTSAALFSLLLADFRGFSEFGFIAGLGVLFAVVSMTIVMPALLVIFERFKLLNMRVDPDYDVNTQPAGPMPVRLSHGIVWVSIGLVVASFFYLPPYFEYQFGKLEPEYTEYNERRDVVRRVYSNKGRRNPAYVITDTPEEIEAVLEALRTSMADSATTIGEIESLQERFPVEPASQQEKLDRIAEVRRELDDPLLLESDSEDIENLRRAASTTRPIRAEEVPEFLKREFTSKSGQIGNFVIIYPKFGLSDGRNSIAFSDEVGTFVGTNGQTYHAGSTSLVAADMLRLMRQEAPYMVALTFAVVVVLMMINFGSIRWALLAIVPLLVGVMWMLLLIGIFDLRLNFYNLIVLPAVLGIGNDAGVHLVHRYRESGPGSIRTVLRSTGEHIFVGALTTMIGFSGPLLSFHPGLRSIGVLAVIGIGTTLLAAIVFLPALIAWIESRRERATRA